MNCTQPQKQTQFYYYPIISFTFANKSTIGMEGEKDMHQEWYEESN
jgi:hypothetical protein